MDFTPHEYQRHAIKWILEKPRCGLFLGMGLGKTVTTLTALDWLINADLSVTDVLVVAPKRVVTDTWATECEKWNHLHDLRVVPIVGTPKQRKEAVAREADIHLVSRDNIKWLVDFLGKKWSYDALVLDELSSFKNPQAARFKALKKVAPRCDRVIGLTGTPAPNGYTDLWSQMYLLDSGDRLGKTLGDFRREYCTAIQFPSFTDYKVNTEKARLIDSRIADICMSMTADDYLKLPPVMYRTVKVALPDKAKKYYKEMLHTAVLEMGDDLIVGMTAATVLGKCLQIASGAVYSNEGDVYEIHEEKLDALEQIVEEAQGEPILLFYNFKFDLERLKLRFPQSRVLEDSEDIKAWNNGKISLLMAHPASCGHGLNLQRGGHIIVWYGLTWSLELYQQANARLNRQGQEKPVMIYHIVAKDTAEERVLQALNAKATTQNKLIECVKAEIEKVVS